MNRFIVELGIEPICVQDFEDSPLLEACYELERMLDADEKAFHSDKSQEGTRPLDVAAPDRH